MDTELVQQQQSIPASIATHVPASTVTQSRSQAILTEQARDKEPGIKLEDDKCPERLLAG